MSIAQTVDVYAALRNSEAYFLAFKASGVFGNQSVCARTYRIRIDGKDIVKRICRLDNGYFTLVVYSKIIDARRRALLSYKSQLPTFL